MNPPRKVTTPAWRRLIVFAALPLALLSALVSDSSATPPLKIQEADFKVT